RVADRVGALIVLLGAAPPRPPRLRQLVEVLARAFQAALGPLGLTLRLGQIALGQQPPQLLGALARPVDLLGQRALRIAGGDAGQLLLQPIDLLLLAL